MEQWSVGRAILTGTRPTTAPPPIATYRLQLDPTFGFDAARELVPGLVALGVSHLYLSPIAEAVPGSTHGYDVVDHTTVRAELGGEAALERLLDTAAAAGLGVLVDHVPNHASVAVPHLNPPWWAMLREGPSSRSARWFDVDWDAGDGRVVVPTLGAPLADVLAAGELTLDTVDGEQVVRYHDTRFPIGPGTGGGDVADVLERQHYRLSWWRDPVRNVRRFFTIDDLVAVCVEDTDVARSIDTLPRRLVEHAAFAGVRIDHVDGLAEPGAYLEGIRDIIGDRWLLVEKILAPGETLPPEWPVDGTTGYEHIVHTEHTLLDPAGAAPLAALWSSTGRETDFGAVEHEARREVLDGGLAPDVDRLLRTIMAGSSGASDGHLDAATWRAAIVELTLGLDRYRTYLPDDRASEAALDRAADRAVANRHDLAEAIAILVGRLRSDREVCTRWQQLTGPVMAKGAEDRAFYRYLPLASLAEVGGAPGTWTISADDFHAHAQRVQESSPTTLNASTTHDTKRSETVRARSLALAARAEQWRRDIEAVFEAASEGVELSNAGVLAALDRADVLLALQTAVTAAPIDADRLGDYLVKAAREAELHTAWTAVDDQYESALRTLAGQIADALAERGSDSEPWRRLAPWVARLAVDGTTVGLRCLALLLTVPGVPDLYQGAPGELTTLVDPDNRLPPDWSAWSELVTGAAQVDLVAAWRNGDADAARAALTRRLLALRARRPGAFGPGAGYAGLDGGGELIAFWRSRPGAEPEIVTVVAPFRAVGDPDIELTLPAGRWRDLVSSDGPEVEGRLATAAWWSGPTAGLGVAVLERVDV